MSTRTSSLLAVPLLLLAGCGERKADPDALRQAEASAAAQRDEAGAIICAAPLKIENGSGSPLRVLALVEREGGEG